MQLVIADKVRSSWSMRPWLALKRAGAAFEEATVDIYGSDAKVQIAAHSPSGLVPVLKTDDGLTIWDTLAICEYLAERLPEAGLWPADPERRALARSAAAEMHSGFASLRGECAMDLKLREQADVSERTATDLRRIVALWSGLRERYGADGPFLVGAWSIADAFYTPVATRIRSYGLKLSDYGDAGPAGAYAATLLETPEFLEWERAALG